MSVPVCPGCGLRSDEAGIPLDRPLNASAACWGLHAELEGYELANLARLGRYHQLTVDAYGAQHAGPPTGQRYVAYSLVGLQLALEDGLTGLDVRAFHSRMGRPDGSWPVFGRPGRPARITVADVVEAGARAGSPDGHARLVERWAADVWASWADRHEDVRSLARRLRSRRVIGGYRLATRAFRSERPARRPSLRPGPGPQAEARGPEPR
jgi:hypothetical protein